MDEKALDELKIDYQNTLCRLKEAADFPIGNQIVANGVIRLFDITFDKAWKWLKAFLQLRGLDVHGPQSSIQEAFNLGLLTEGESWLEMLEDRDWAGRTCDEDEVLRIYQRIVSRHLRLLEELPQLIDSSPS